MFNATDVETMAFTPGVDPRTQARGPVGFAPARALGNIPLTRPARFH